MTKKETFQEMKQRIISKKKGDFISLSSEGTFAAVYETRRARILHAMIVMQTETKQSEWRIEQGHLISCPDQFSLCIKNIGNAAVCIGDENDESSYHFLRLSEDGWAEPLSIIGVIELDEEAVAFLFDWKAKKIHYLYLERESDEDSDLYVLMTEMRKLEVMNNGKEPEKTTRW